MLRILIADDSATEIQCIQFLIRKFNFPMQMDTADNGCTALEMIRRNRYDILLTDIKMPLLDGIHLVREARNLQPDLAVLIFSGYGKFEYAQSAISLGVTEYLLKPVDANALREALCRVVSELNQRNLLQRNLAFARRHLLFSLLNGETVANGREIMPDYRLMAAISFNHAFFSSDGEQFSSLLPDKLNCYCDFISLYPSEGLIFFPSDSPDPRQLVKQLRALVAQFTDVPCEIVLSPLGGAKDILPAYQQLTLLESEDNCAETVQFPLSTCLEAIRRGDAQLCIEHYERFRTAVLDGCSYSSTYTRFALSQVLCTLNSLLPTGMTDNALVDRVFSCHDFSALDSWIHSIFERIGVGPTHSPVQRSDEIKAYIARHYAEPDLGLKDIAATCYLSPNYLCRLFKRETGVTLLKYINDYRMSHAQELLTATSMKVNLVAQKVGYRSASYFTQRFRDCFDMTPEAFRMNAMRGRCTAPERKVEA